MNKLLLLFNTQMVQAYQRGQKTETRRVRGLEKVNENPDDWEYLETVKTKWYYLFFLKNKKDGLKYCLKTKSPNDLWMRETFQKVCDIEDADTFYYLYKSDNNKQTEIKEIERISDKKFTWKPSLFMPNDAVRYKEKIVNIKFERLQEITEEDCINEGIELLLRGGYRDYLDKKTNLLTSQGTTAKDSFHSLWQSINKGTQYDWDKNPWIIAYQFENQFKEVKQ